MTSSAEAGRATELAERLRAAGCIFAEEEAEVLIACDVSVSELETMVERRVAGAPLEHVVGWASFAGLRVPVEPGVFVPRRRTELLTAEAISCLPPEGIVVELCCGAAAISAALLDAHPSSTVHAADVDPAAVRNARRTLAGIGSGSAHVHEGDLYWALPRVLRGRVDVVVANVPYVPTAEIEFMPAEARLHESRLSLDGGVDGLDIARRLLRGAAAWLRAGGVVMFEVAEPQVDAALRAADSVGLEPAVVRDSERDAVVVCAYHGRRRARDADFVDDTSR